MVTDLQEADMIAEYIENLKVKEEGGVDFEKGTPMTKKEIDREFDNLDISQYNDKK
jgi:hypothetical protein